METSCFGRGAARFLSSTAPVLAAVLLIFGLVPGAVEAGSVLTAIMVNPGAQAFIFKNPDTTYTATDFEVALRFPTRPLIGGGTGGAPFPNMMSAVPGQIVYYVGGTGIPPGGQYTHSFPGWPAGTTFSVSFSYAEGPLVDQGPIVVKQDNFVTQGLTFPVTEPTSLTLLGLGLSGMLGYAGWRRGCRGTPWLSASRCQPST